MKHWLGFILALIGIALAGCGTLSSTATPFVKAPPPPITRALEPAQSPAPGNAPPAKPQITPNVKPPIAPPGNLIANAKTYSVTNPTTNAKLNVQVFTPKDSAGKKFPALVLVPGGIGDGNGLIREAEEFMNAGFVAVIFDPDGRGKSEGVEDFNGHKHQDGLAAVARFTATLPEVDAKKIGIATFSYGITMGAGALARYSDTSPSSGQSLPVKFLIDWEGPVDRDDTTVGCRNDGNQRIGWKPCTDNAFWSEREALTFIAKVRVPYQRIQSEKDHVQPDVSHAIHIVNAAVQAKLPFVRLNDYPPNQTYAAKNPPPMFSENQDRQRNAFVIKYAVELANR